MIGLYFYGTLCVPCSNKMFFFRATYFFIFKMCQMKFFNFLLFLYPFRCSAGPSGAKMSVDGPFFFQSVNKTSMCLDSTEYAFKNGQGINKCDLNNGVQKFWIDWEKGIVSDNMGKCLTLKYRIWSFESCTDSPYQQLVIKMDHLLSKITFSKYNKCLDISQKNNYITCDRLSPSQMFYLKQIPKS
jgi:hypothetical protein